jgi:hypothetical protein
LGKRAAALRISGASNARALASAPSSRCASASDGVT